MTFGAGDVPVVEPPDAIRTVLVKWRKIKNDLNELPRLRWIEKMPIIEICKRTKKGRSSIEVSIRTIRDSGISQLNLKYFEREVIKKAIFEEIQILSKTKKAFDPKTIKNLKEYEV